MEKTRGYITRQKYLGDHEKVGAIVEGIAADQMVRLSFRLCEQKQLFCSEDSVLYWRGKKEREVDFVLKQGLPKPEVLCLRSRRGYQTLLVLTLAVVCFDGS